MWHDWQPTSSATKATCHTLTTEAFDADGNVVGSLPEQVPYQEWQHSAAVLPSSTVAVSPLSPSNQWTYAKFA